MAIEDKIIKLEPDDIISDSMNKINHNFKIIEFSERVFEEKLQSFSKRYENELEDLRNNCNSDNVNILNSINNLSDKIYTTYDNSNIQDAVNNAILNADQELINFIRDKAGEQISASMNDYAKKSSLNELYSAFTQYKADEKTKQASVNTIVTNSRYCRDSEGKLCYLDGTSSGYKTLEEYYNNGLSSAEKATVNGSSTDGLSDPDVLERFLKLCETTFKTEFKELASIMSSVGGGVSKTSIVNAVRGSGNLGNDENIVAAIFVEANENNGSSIKLNANNLNLTGNSVIIDTDNLKVNKNGDGKVTVKGEIEATSGKIGQLNVNSNGLSFGKIRITTDGIKVVGGTNDSSTYIYLGDSSYPLMCGGATSSTAVTKISSDGKIFSNSAEFRQPIIQNDVYESIIDDSMTEREECYPNYIELNAANYRVFNIERLGPIYLDGISENNTYFQNFEFRFSNLLQNVVYTVSFKLKHEYDQEYAHTHTHGDWYDAYVYLGSVLLKIKDMDRNISYVDKTAEWAGEHYDIGRNKDEFNMLIIIDAGNGQYGTFQFMVTTNNEIRLLSYNSSFINASYRYR